MVPCYREQNAESSHLELQKLGTENIWKCPESFNSQSLPPVISSSNKVTPSKSFQIVITAGDQEFKFMSLWAILFQTKAIVIIPSRYLLSKITHSRELANIEP